MIAARSGRTIFGHHEWRRAVLATDWTRVLWEARGLHLQQQHEGDVCGVCIQDILLRME